MNSQGKKYNVSAMIWQMIVALLGEIGIVGALYTTHALYVNQFIVYGILCLMTIVFIIGIHIKKIGKIIIPIYDVVLIFILLLFGKRMIQGIVYLVNDIYDSIFNGKIVTPSPEQLEIIKVNEWLAVVMFCVVVTCLVCANIYYVRSVALSLIMVLPLVCVYTICLKIPPYPIWICCVTHVLCVSSMDEKSVCNVKFIIAMSAVISVVMLSLSNTKDYKRPQFFVQINNNILALINSNEYLANMTYFVDGLFGNGDGDVIENSVIYGSNGSHIGNIKGGQLGKVDEIKYEHQDIFTMRTPNIENHQYIAVFYGKKYIEDSNYWLRKETYEESDEYTNFLLNRVRAVPNWQRYLERTTGLEMKDNFYRFERTFSRRNIKDTSGVKINHEYYQGLQDISDGIINKEDDELIQIAQNEVMQFSKKANAIVNYNYLQISAPEKELIFNMAGQRSVMTLEQKMACIEYVKNFLQSNYSYTLSPGKIPEDKDFFEYFFNESKEGYCTYFATAATLMFRAYGIPARYVEGYAVPFDRIISSTYETNKDRYIVEVKDSDAHAWTQVYLYGIGWVNVDATPAGTGIASITQTNFPNTAQIDEDLDLIDEDDEDEKNEEIIDESDEDETLAPVLNTTTNITETNSFKGFILAVLIILLLGMGIAFYIVLRKRKINIILNSHNIIIIYNYLEKVMTKAGYLRPEYMEYESFGNYMEETNEFFRKMKFSQMCKMVTNVDLSGGRYVVGSKQTKEFAYKAKQLRKYMISNNISWYVRWLY